VTYSPMTSPVADRKSPSVGLRINPGVLTRSLCMERQKSLFLQYKAQSPKTTRILARKRTEPVGIEQDNQAG
jgi:hypothetical protein